MKDSLRFRAVCLILLASLALPSLGCSPRAKVATSQDAAPPAQTFAVELSEPQINVAGMEMHLEVKYRITKG